MVDYIKKGNVYWKIWANGNKKKITKEKYLKGLEKKEEQEFETFLKQLEELQKQE